MNTKISVFVIYVETIIYLLLYNLHDCTFKYERRYDLQRKIYWHSDVKVLLTSCFHYNSEEKSIKLLIPKMKLNIVNKYEFPYASCIIKCLEGFEGMTNF